jgi:hypothetical protein
MLDFKFEIKETTGVISVSRTGWTKELNIISWGGKEPKYDIREWYTDHKRTGNGITLSIEELKKLIAILNKIEL